MGAATARVVARPAQALSPLGRRARAYRATRRKSKRSLSFWSTTLTLSKLKASTCACKASLGVLEQARHGLLHVQVHGPGQAGQQPGLDHQARRRVVHLVDADVFQPHHAAAGHRRARDDRPRHQVDAQAAALDLHAGARAQVGADGDPPVLQRHAGAFQVGVALACTQVVLAFAREQGLGQQLEHPPRVPAGSRRRESPGQRSATPAAIARRAGNG